MPESNNYHVPSSAKTPTDKPTRSEESLVRRAIARASDGDRQANTVLSLLTWSSVCGYGCYLLAFLAYWPLLALIVPAEFLRGFFKSQSEFCARRLNVFRVLEELVWVATAAACTILVFLHTSSATPAVLVGFLALCASTFEYGAKDVARRAGFTDIPW